MASPESDAHGSTHRSVEVSVETFPLDHDDDDLVVMSSGVKVRREDMAEYQRQYAVDEEAGEHGYLKEAMIFASAATLSFAAVALARRRLNRNK